MFMLSRDLVAPEEWSEMNEEKDWNSIEYKND
jgi:hypothetical protein